MKFILLTLGIICGILAIWTLVIPKWQWEKGERPFYFILTTMACIGGIVGYFEIVAKQG